MPNTLVHLGVQSVSTKALISEADFKWIAVGCIIPDIPWIFKRIVVFLDIDVDRYLLVQYTSVQASFFCCLILCGAFALATSSSFRLFLLLAMNVFLHLLLDALQIKWANGVHFVAPFSWQLTQLNVVWPEHAIIYTLTIAGLGTLVYYALADWKKDIALTWSSGKMSAAGILLALYLIMPIWLQSGPLKANNFYLLTLYNVAQRPGAYLELDRSRFRASDNSVEIFSGERIKVTGKHPLQDAILSVKGNFVDQKTLSVSSFKIHGPVRDLASKLALIGVLLMWLFALFKNKIRFAEKTEEKNR